MVAAANEKLVAQESYNKYGFLIICRFKTIRLRHEHRLVNLEWTVVYGECLL